MNDSADAWADEIRDYLLGRLSSKTQMICMAPERAKLTHPPVRRWWTFEGKRYASLGNSLANSWDVVIRYAQQLEQTFNPRLQLNDRIEGVVDWPRTISRGPLQLHSQYFVRSSSIGLDEDERSALRGWAAWITHEWAEYTLARGAEERLEWRGFQPYPQGPVSVDRLRRWAHTARRSRWTLLRDVVAESLRPVLEPEELDRIPLPAERSRLFELLCLVRIAIELAPMPRELRWLDRESASNTLRLDGVRCLYQQALTRESVLSTVEYQGSLAKAVQVFGVGLPESIDVAFDFDVVRAGFDGIIIEAKSGNQTYRNAVAQLRIYRAARPRRPEGRFLVWGVVESPDRPDTTIEQVREMLSTAGSAEDVWLFSSADAIPVVLQAVFGDKQSVSGPGASRPAVSEASAVKAQSDAFTQSLI